MDKEEKKETKKVTKKSTSIKKSTAKKTTVKKPATKKTATKVSAAKKETATKKTTAKKPATKKTTTKTSTTKKETTAKKPAAKKPAVKKATTKASTTKKKATTPKKRTTKKSTVKEELTINNELENVIEEQSVVVVEDHDQIDDIIDELLSPTEGIKPVVEDNNEVEVPEVSSEPEMPVEEEITPVEPEITTQEEIPEVETVISEEPKPPVKRKKVLKGWVYITLMAIVSVLLLFMIIRLINGKPINDYLNDKYVQIVNNEITIDFDELKKENNKIVGYIKVDGTDIKHFVVRGNNNEYYLNHDLKNDESKNGSIFADYRNKLDGTDKSIVLYGLDNSKTFGSLNKVLKKGWQESNNKITFLTKRGTYKYQVISTYKTSEKYNYVFDNQTDYLKFVNNLILKSNYNYQASVSNLDEIITLVSIDGDKKIVLHAKMINN